MDQGLFMKDLVDLRVLILRKVGIVLEQTLCGVGLALASSKVPLASQLFRYTHAFHFKVYPNMFHPRFLQFLQVGLSSMTIYYL